MEKQPYHEWEIKHDLQIKNVDGFQYWNYMRRDMTMSFKDEYASLEPAFYAEMKEQGREGLLLKLKKAMLLLIPDTGSGAVKSDCLFLCHSRRQEIDGKMVSIYSDYVADRFPGSVTLQRSGLGKYKRDRIYSRNLYFLDKISVKSYIYRYLMELFKRGEYRRVREQVYSDMEEPFRDLSENYGLHPDPDAFADRVTILYYLYKYRRPRLEKLLKKISPRVIVEVVGLSFDAKIINELSYDLGIETIELQHGTGGLSLNYPEGKVMKQFVKWYFAFGDFWKAEMKPPISSDHVISAGFPYHDMEMEAYPPEKRESGKNTVIFLSSRKYGKELSEVAAELKKLRPETKVIFKLHPREYGEYKEKYTALRDVDLEVVDDNKTPLYALFSRCSMQVGVESTAIYEGMGFGLKTFIWDIPRAAAMRALVNSGAATLFQDAKELSSLMERGEGEGTGYDSDSIWKKDSLNTIEREIRRIGGLAPST